jgi:thymidine kinase
MTTAGRLELILGPMFSGKTTRLIEQYHLFTKQNIKVIAINFADDTRYHSSKLSTHDNVMIPCVQCHNLNEIIDTDDIKNSSVILINEGQFFQDIFEIVVNWVEHQKKHVIICGLDGDFKRIKFGKLCDLIPFCDSIVKLYANCKCGKNAIFSHRITNEVAQVVIGSSNYVPLCRACYLYVNNLSTVNCECCDNRVSVQNSEPFVTDTLIITDKFICTSCIESNLDNETLYKCYWEKCKSVG